MQRQEPLRAKEFQIAEIDDHSAAITRLHDIFGEGARVRPVDVAVGADNGDRRHRPPSIESCVVSPAEWSRSIGSHVGSIRFVEPGWIPVRSTRVAANLLTVFCGGALQPAPVQRPLCASGATAPTMIQKRNVAPVGPGVGVAVHACFRSVSGPSLRCSPHRCAEQNTLASQDTRFGASHLLVCLQ